jgi:hypothetical protein
MAKTDHHRARVVSAQPRIGETRPTGASDVDAMSVVVGLEGKGYPCCLTHGAEPMIAFEVPVARAIYEVIDAYRKLQQLVRGQR